MATFIARGVDELTKAKNNPEDPNAISAAFDRIIEILKDQEKQIYRLEERLEKLELKVFP